MEFLHKWLPQVWDFMNEYKVLGALIIVAAFCIVSIVLVGAITGEQWISPRPPFDFIFIAVLKSVLVLIWAQAINRVLLRIADDWIRHWREASRHGSEMIRLGGSIARLVVLAGAIFLFLSLWKINITPLLASAGIAGVAVALAAKETLSNFFGGITVLLDQPYRVGDYIILDSGERGEVAPGFHSQFGHHQHQGHKRKRPRATISGENQSRSGLWDRCGSGGGGSSLRGPR
jgi:small-conductance mechanosensitive channel